MVVESLFCVVGVVLVLVVLNVVSVRLYVGMCWARSMAMGVMVQRLDGKEKKSEWSLHFVALEEKKKKTHNKHMSCDMTALFIHGSIHPKLAS